MAALILPATSITVDQEDMTLDLVCFDHAYAVLRDRRRAGRLRGYVEATLEANQDLARMGLVLPLGQVVKLPEFVVELEERAIRRLWD